MVTLKIRLLGTFQLAYNNSPVETVHQARQQSLLAYLLLHRDAPQTRQRVAFLFWPDMPDSQAFANLRKTLYRVRRSLPDADQFLHVDAQTIQWQTEAAFTLDVLEFERRLVEAAEARKAGRAQEAVRALQAATDLYGGRLLPGCDDDWILPERERLEQQLTTALEELIRLQEEARDYAAAIDTARRLLRHDALHEPTYRRLMKLHLLNNDRAEALRVYHTCANLLQQELDVPPTLATQAIYERIKNQPGALIQPPAPAHRAAVSLVGRQAEWRWLLQAWRQASQGASRLALIAGEAGIGKSRLAEELLAWAGQQGFPAARSRAYAAGSLAYGPVVDWLRAEAIQSGWQTLEPVWRAELARLLPELLADQPASARPRPMTESWQRLRLFEALARAVLATRPLLLLLDDLQWADVETLEWLGYLLRFEARAPLLVVGTVRPEEIGPTHPLTELLNHLRWAELLTDTELEPLNAAETAELAALVAPETLGEETLAQLYRDSQGNPLFIVEMVRAGREEVGPQKEAAGSTLVPPRVQAMIEARLAQLSPASRDLVNLAAVIGREFTFELLAAASQTGAETLVNALDEAWQRRILREHGQESYDFSHDKIRDIAFANLSSARRRLLHLRVAQALEQVHAGGLDIISGRLGEHYQQAGQPEKARECFYQAGRWAAGQFANSEAVAYLGRALALTPEEDLANRYQLLFFRQKLYHIQAAVEARQKDLDTLKQLAKALADDRKGAEVLVEVVTHLTSTSAYQEAVVVAGEAARLARAARVLDLEAKACLVWGDGLWHLGDTAAAKSRVEQALSLARTAPLRDIEGRVLYWLATADLFVGNYATIKAHLEGSLAISREIADWLFEGYTLNQLAYLTLEHGEGDYDQAAAWLAQGLALSRQKGDRRMERHFRANQGLFREHQGDYSQAMTDYEQTLRLSREIEDHKGTGLLLMYIGNIYRHYGATAEARRHYEQAMPVLQAIDFHHGQARTLNELGLLAHQLGDEKAARDFSRQALSIAESWNFRRDQGYALTRLGYALAGLGRLDEAERAYQRALAIQQELGQFNRSLESRAGLARLYLARQEPGQALAQVETILPRLDNAAWCGLAEPFRVHLTCYRVLQANGDPRAPAVLADARSRLEHRAAAVTDTGQRRSYLENVAAHQALLAE